LHSVRKNIIFFQKKIAKPPNYGKFSFFLSESEKFSCVLLEKTPPFSKKNRNTSRSAPPPLSCLLMLAASRHLCPHLLILLQGSKEHWGAKPPLRKISGDVTIQHQEKSIYVKLVTT
jgi:hypothetical protein